MVKKVIFDYKPLRLKILEVFDNQRNFAEAMELPYSQINLRLNNKVYWKTQDIYKACMLLGIPLVDVHKYFFKVKV